MYIQALLNYFLLNNTLTIVLWILQTNLEDNDQQILLLKLEKRSLQEQIIRLLDEKAQDLGMTEDEKNNELAKLKVGLNTQSDVFI